MTGQDHPSHSHHDVVGQLNAEKEYERTHDPHLHDAKKTGHNGEVSDGVSEHKDPGSSQDVINQDGNKMLSRERHENSQQNPDSKGMQRDNSSDVSGPDTDAVSNSNPLICDSKSIGASLDNSTSSQKGAKQEAAERRELEEARKKKAKETAKARRRAKKLARLQEEQANKTMKFLQKHADPETAKRTDYVFPDHGIQKPGVGEAHIKHRDYAYDSMYLNNDGSLQSQKDELKSSLLETVLQDVRLKSPVHGENRRPLTPGERQVLEQSLHLASFQQTYSGSIPPTPDFDHRNIRHQIQILQNTIRENETFVAEPSFTYDDTAGFGKPNQNDMSQQNYLTASQRFRMEAEKQRKIREEEALAAAEKRAREAEEREKAALKAAGIKEPKRKKLQKAPKKVEAEPIPIAYAVGGKGASIVPSRVPSRVRKPKKNFSKEQRPECLLNGRDPCREVEAKEHFEGNRERLC